MEFVKGYHENEAYCHSLDELVRTVFGISFSVWRERGYWGGKYEPYSYIDQGRIVANVSVSRLGLLVDGEVKTAIQIGAVMTHPDYRQRGLADDLLRRVLADYENCDVMYLFANHSVLELYPKYGFRPVIEQQFTLTYQGGVETPAVQKLDGRSDADLQFMYELAKQRAPVSPHFATVDAAELLMFYGTTVFPDDLYYVAETEAIVLYRQIADELHIFDIISKAVLPVEQVLRYIAPPQKVKVVLYFTGTAEMETEPFQGSEVLFVKTNVPLPAGLRHPLTSQA